MLPLGTTAPDFTLTDVSGQEMSLDDFRNKDAYLIAFICVHCPYVKHIEKKFAQLANKYQQQNVAVIAINSNDPNHNRHDDIDGMRHQASRCDFTFPYFFDADQSVAKAYKAACTPDLYVFDANKKLVYRGQFDKTRPGLRKATGEDIKIALDAVLNNQPVPADQQPSTGCNIKWQPGNEPEYS